MEKLERIKELIKTLENEIEKLAGFFKIGVEGGEKGLYQSNKLKNFAVVLESAIESMATAMEEMSATIKDISHNAQESSIKARESLQAAERTYEVVQALTSVANNISEMNRLIGKIADQTNYYNLTCNHFVPIK